MAANTIKITAQHDLGEEALRLREFEEAESRSSARLSAEPPALEAAPEEKPADSATDGQGFALAPLVDKIAYAFASGLVVAMRELETHIAGETRQVSSSVNGHLGSLQASVQELTEALSEQRSLSSAVDEKCRELETITTSLRQAEERQEADLAAVRTDAAALAASVAERFELTCASVRDSEGRHDVRIAALRDETRELSTSLSERVQTLEHDLTAQQEDLSAVRACSPPSTRRSTASQSGWTVRRRPCGRCSPHTRSAKPNSSNS